MNPKTFDFLSAELRLLLKKLTYVRERLGYVDRDLVGVSIFKHLSDAQNSIEEANAELLRLASKPATPPD